MLMNYSIKKGLIWFSLLLFILFASIITLVSYFNARHEVNEIYNAQYLWIAQNLIRGDYFSQNKLNASASSTLLKTELTDYVAKINYAVIDSTGQVIKGVKQDFNISKIKKYEPQLIPMKPKWVTERFKGENWSIMLLKLQNQQLLVVGSPLAVRAEAEKEIAWRQTWPLLIVILIYFLFMVFILNYSFNHLNKISQQISNQSIYKLKFIPYNNIPIELHPLIKEINQLIERVQLSMLTEKQFTADAAHELRTPISALKLLSEEFSQVKNVQEMKEYSGAITQLVKRMQILSEQLLTFHRVQNPQEKESINLKELISESIYFNSPQMDAKNQTITFEEDGLVCEIIGEKLNMLYMLNNLISNAVKYTPSNGKICITLKKEPGQIKLVVEDSGEGIEPKEIKKVRRRFYRQKKHIGSIEGSGLGLSIIQTVVDNHQGKMQLEKSQSLGGLKATIILPIQNS